ncbi:MAG: IS3 family transposase [bacterium]
MSFKRHTVEQIISKLRQAEVELSQGKTIEEVCRSLEISNQSYYKWKKEYGGLKVNQARRLKELETENARLKQLVAELSLDKNILQEYNKKKHLSVPKRRKIIEDIATEYDWSERRICKALGQVRATQRYKMKIKTDEQELKARIIELACQYGRYGYRRITALLRAEGIIINHKRVERIWRQEGLKVPRKQSKRKRLWLNDGSCVRLRPERANHVWSYDFIMAQTSDQRTIKMLTIIDEYTRESLAIKVERNLKTEDVQEVLTELFIRKGIPEYIRSDNGSEFTATIMLNWLKNLGVKTLFIEPGSPWENGYIESFHSRFRDECLNREIFDTLWEAKVVVENWRKEYNTVRPHSSLGYNPPAPVTYEPVFSNNSGRLNLCSTSH